MPGKGYVPTPEEVAHESAKKLWRIERDKVATNLILNEGLSPVKAQIRAAEQLGGKPLEND